MKNFIRIKEIHKYLWFLFGITIMVSGCEEGTNIRDAEYPDQLIYMPAAVGGRFVIDEIAERIGDPPVAGHPYRYLVDPDSREFIIPLAVYRAGIDNKGGFTIDIAVNNDTINDIIASGDSIKLLPANQYTMVNSVDMPDGEELAKFNLIVDLDFLRNNYPDNIYALGVSISSPARDRNPELSTTIVVIHTSIMKPTSGFSYKSAGTDPKTIDFLNNSEMATNYSWNFGDGSEASDEENPSHTYSAPGTYTITLTAFGITGDQDKSTFSEEITIP